MAQLVAPGTLIREATWIRKTNNTNQDEGRYQLSHVWDKLLHTDDRHRKSVLMTASDVSGWVSVKGLTSHSTHNRSFWRGVFPDNQLHWYWQPKTIKHNTTYTRNTKEKQKKTALANKIIYTLIWFLVCLLRPLIRKQSGPYSYSPGVHTGCFWHEAKSSINSIFLGCFGVI